MGRSGLVGDQCVSEKVESKHCAKEFSERGKDFGGSGAKDYLCFLLMKNVHS